jgi:hypothetical protein
MTSYIVSQILGNLPSILVLLAGGVAAVVFIQRAQTAAILTLVGVAVMLFAVLTQMTISIGWPNIATVSRVLLGLMEAISLGMILAAVFAGYVQPSQTTPAREIL